MNEEKKARPSWDEYFSHLANLVGERGTCDRGQCGALITIDKRIVSTGYAGSPSGTVHCDEVGHEMHTVIHEDGSQSQHCIRTTHAEQNAICQAAKRGVAIDGATLYCRMTPCRTCGMMIINCGIKRVVAERRYHAGADSEAMFREAGVELEYVHDEVEKYENQ